MKKIVALIGIFLLAISCSLESDNPRFYSELLPVESYEMPTAFYVDTENEIVLRYINPSTCHAFDGFYYEKVDFTRTVAIQTGVVDQANCSALNNQIVTKILKFKPEETGVYLFKFWKGRDANGVNIFEEIAVDVQ
jgi:hypothetical protein